MAVSIDVVVHGADVDAMWQLDGRISSNGPMPPVGLLVHLVRPEGDGFRVTDVFGREEDCRLFYAERLLPALQEGALRSDEPVLTQVWAMAP